MRQKGSGAGRNFTRTFSKSNTLPIQISLTLVETSGGMTSVGLWFRSLSWDSILNIGTKQYEKYFKLEDYEIYY